MSCSNAWDARANWIKLIWNIHHTESYLAFLCILSSAAGSVLGLGVLRILRHSWDLTARVRFRSLSSWLRNDCNFENHPLTSSVASVPVWARKICFLLTFSTQNPLCTFVYTKPAKDLPELHGRPCSAQNLSVECSHREIPAVWSIGVHCVLYAVLSTGQKTSKKPGLFWLDCDTDATSGARDYKLNLPSLLQEDEERIAVRLCRFILGIKLFLRANQHACVFYFLHCSWKDVLANAERSFKFWKTYLKNDRNCSHVVIPKFNGFNEHHWKWMDTGHNEHLWQTRKKWAAHFDDWAWGRIKGNSNLENKSVSWTSRFIFLAHRKLAGVFKIHTQKYIGPTTRYMGRLRSKPGT